MRPILPHVQQYNVLNGDNHCSVLYVRVPAAWRPGYVAAPPGS